MQRNLIKKENIQKKLNKLRILYKLDRRLIKRSILYKKDKRIDNKDNNKEIDISKRRFDNKQLLYKKAIGKIRKNN